MFLIVYSINWPNFILWLPVLLEILDNMCIATVFFKGRDVINFQINRIFLIKLFYYYLTKKSRQKLTYLIKWEKKSQLARLHLYRRQWFYKCYNFKLYRSLTHWVESLRNFFRLLIWELMDATPTNSGSVLPRTTVTLSQNTQGFICLWALHSPCCQRFDHLFVWILPFDLPGLVRPARSWSFRQYSS